MITHNEEHNIRRCLESVKFADEIIVLDSGSTDKTVEIAKEYTDKVYHQDWLGFSGQRNMSLSYVTGDWIFIIDADEEVSMELANSIIDAIYSTTDKLAYNVTRENYFMGKVLNGTTEEKPRLFKSGTLSYKGDVHEKTVHSKPAGKLKGVLHHYTYTNLTCYADKWNSYSTLAAKERFDAGRTANVLSVVFCPVIDFIKTYIIKGGFISGVPGLISSVIHAHYTFLKYAKLYELNKCKTTFRDWLIFICVIPSLIFYSFMREE
jgi:glycosyltransferase involved in cell wall biosynthesis